MVKPWKMHREEITTLYIKEAKTLDEVQRIMKERRGFVASIRSYRQRFDQWDLQKYNCKKRQQRKAEENQRRMYPSPPTSPENGLVLPVVPPMGIKAEDGRYCDPPAWRYYEPLHLPPHYGGDRVLQPYYQQRHRYMKQRCHQPVPERKYQPRQAPPSGVSWYPVEPQDHFLPPFHTSPSDDIKHDTFVA